MSRRAYLTLAAATLIAVVVALVLVLTTGVTNDRQQAAGEPLFPNLVVGVDDLRGVTIEARRYTLHLVYRDGRWLSSDRGDYPVRPDAIVGIVTSLAGMTIVEEKTNNPDWYTFVGVAGVGAPGSESVRVALIGEGDRVLADAIVGNASQSVGVTRGGGLFVRRNNEAETWLVEGRLDIPPFVQEWFDPILHVPGTDVARTTIVVGGEILLDAQKVDFATGDYEFTFLSPTVGPAGSTANDNGMRGVAQAIVTTAFDDARRREDITFPTGSRTVRFETRQGLKLEVALGEFGGETWVVYTASADAGAEAAEQAREITALTEHWAFKLPPHRIVALNRPFEELFTPPPPPEAPPAPGGLIPGQPLPLGPGPVAP